MPRVKLTETEKNALRSIGKKAHADMVRKVGKKKLAAIARAQGHHGIEGGRPRLYDPCPLRRATKKTPSRHRFVNGVCGCGERQKR
jgi:hypothetical protein